MTDFLDRKRGEIAARIAELKPLVEEYRLLQAVASALDLVDSEAQARANANANAKGRRLARIVR